MKFEGWKKAAELSYATGEGSPRFDKRLLSPALSSIGWRRGSGFAALWFISLVIPSPDFLRPRHADGKNLFERSPEIPERNSRGEQQPQEIKRIHQIAADKHHDES